MTPSEARQHVYRGVCLEFVLNHFLDATPDRVELALEALRGLLRHDDHEEPMPVGRAEALIRQAVLTVVAMERELAGLGCENT